VTPERTTATEDVLRLLPATTGHFLLESGHHGELWLDVERLCLHPGVVRALAGRLASRLSAYGVEAVCGPLVEGAFVALMVAEQLGLPFTYSQPQRGKGAALLFPVAYRIPEVLRPEIEGRRIAVVNDVINAGSAVRGTLEHLRAWGAQPVVVATLAVLGDSAARLARDSQVPLESLAERPNRIWTPRECPLCARGVPLRGR